MKVNSSGSCLSPELLAAAGSPGTNQTASSRHAAKYTGRLHSKNPPVAMTSTLSQSLRPQPWEKRPLIQHYHYLRANIADQLLSRPGALGRHMSPVQAAWSALRLRASARRRQLLRWIAWQCFLRLPTTPPRLVTPLSLRLRNDPSASSTVLPTDQPGHQNVASSENSTPGNPNLNSKTGGDA